MKKWTTMSLSNKPLSEQYRLKGIDWAVADKAASIMEELKSVRLSQLIQTLIAEKGDMPHAKAEREVKASPEWEAEIRAMVIARMDANILRVELEALRMQHAENQSFEANRRAEMRL